MRRRLEDQAVTRLSLMSGRTTSPFERMAARRAKGIAMRKADDEARRQARQKVEAAKIALGERGPVWWMDGTPYLNRHMVKNTPYAAWFAALEHGELPLKSEAG